jgi:aminopeptidase
MIDPRNESLAKMLVEYSVALQPGEKIYIEIKGDEAWDLGRALIAAATKAGGIPFWYYNDEDVSRHFVQHAQPEQFQKWGEFHKEIMQSVDAYIAVRGSNNPFDHADMPPKQSKGFMMAYWEEIHAVRVKEKRWCVLRYPNPAMAILAQKATGQFAEYYYDVCTMDYAHMSKAMDPLVELMAATDHVEIKGPGTELSFSIKGIGAVKCDGHRNVPDGEVYSCPVRDSVNGVITYSAASMYQGTLFRGIRFEVKDGRIIEATCEGDEDKLNRILDTDEGARYFGEFALGLNPYITAPMLDILFDEKIGGSFHLTPGQAYDQTDNGNESAVHWDLVSIQTPEYGGGTISFDGRVIREDGRFVAPELEGLNPERLRSP